VSTGPASGELLSALQQVLGTEHAAVYGYGLVGARLTRTEESTATAAFVAHEARRDVVRRMILDRGGTPVAALPAYRPRIPVVDRQSALRLAAELEEDTMAAYIAVIGATDDPAVRRSTAGWLADAAVRDELWRARIGPLALTQAPPLPGLQPPPAPSPTNPPSPTFLQ
jgi:Domain of unknown function (DUF4439)